MKIIPFKQLQPRKYSSKPVVVTIIICTVFLTHLLFFRFEQIVTIMVETIRFTGPGITVFERWTLIHRLYGGTRGM